MPFAQLVIGAPGAGKSTYCNGMHQFMGAIGRKCSVVNLDPANDRTSYPAALDVRDLIPLEEAMESEELGPNGGVLYALEELEHNFEWLEEGLKELGDDYILFDCPGQVELFTHHASLRNIFFRLQKLGCRLVVVALTDSYVLTQPSLYISALLLALRSMLQMDLPHLNVLTKIDNLANYGDLPFNLEFYTEVHSLEYLLPHLAREQTTRNPSSKKRPREAAGDTSKAAGDEGQDAMDVDVDEDEDEDEEGDATKSKFEGLNRAIIELVEEYGLVGFETLAVEDKKSMMVLLRAIDKASGYAFGGVEGANDTVWQIAMRQDATTMDARDVQERWIDRREEFDELERQEWEEEAKAMVADDEEGPVKIVDKRTRAESEGGRLDSDEEDLEEMQRAMAKDSGIKIVRKG